VTLRRHLLLLAAILLGGSTLFAAERIPAAPPRYFNDFAGVVSRPVAERLNAQLEQFERTNSSQLLVAIYPRMESASSVEDYTVRVAQAWRAGQTGKDNGAVLFVFMQSHDLYLQVGYGLEPVLPDALAKRIITTEIVPRFRVGDIDGGMTSAVNAMMAAARGEYQGTGRTAAENQAASRTISPGAVFTTLLLLLILGSFFFRLIRYGLREQPTVLSNPRRRNVITDNTWWNGGGGGFGGGGFGGGGGGFSGGGGSFGGGGAGGKW
jgi:uncharacterized protein